MQNNFIVLHAQNTTALQPNLFLTVLHQLLITSKGSLKKKALCSFETSGVNNRATQHNNPEELISQYQSGRNLQSQNRNVLNSKHIP